MIETSAGGRAYRVVPRDGRVEGIGEGEPVVLLSVEDVLADATLPRLPTVRRVAREGLRGVLLVPLSEWESRALPASGQVELRS